jgi:DNA-binding transcriptional LysR family regulator
MMAFRSSLQQISQPPRDGAEGVTSRPDPLATGQFPEAAVVNVAIRCGEDGGDRMAGHIMHEAHGVLLWLITPAFQARFPEISLELSIADRRVGVIGEQVDVAIRTGGTGDSRLVTRRIGDMRRVICASPAYIARHGVPLVPADLARHNCMLLTGFARLADWPMRVDGKTIELEVKGTITCNSAELLFDMACAWLGIARFGDFLAEEALARGELVPLLVEHHVVEVQPISALMPPGRQHLPRVRAFVDFLAAEAGRHDLPLS